MRWELVDPFEETTWSGPTNLNGDDFHADSIYADREKLDYRVIKMKWKRLVPTELERRWRKEGSLLKLNEHARPIAKTECEEGLGGVEDRAESEQSAYTESEFAD